MSGIETSQQRAGGTEAERRRDGGGQPQPLPASEEARGNKEPKVDAPHGAEEQWTPEGGTRKTDPANADRKAEVNRGRYPSTGSGAVTGSGAGAGGGGSPEDYDDDPQAGGGSVDPRSSSTGPRTGADAPSHGSR